MEFVIQSFDSINVEYLKNTSLFGIHPLLESKLFYALVTRKVLWVLPGKCSTRKSRLATIFFKKEVLECFSNPLILDGSSTIRDVMDWMHQD